MADRRADRENFDAVLLCFLLSGFAALLYQTAWTRQFSFVFGTSELAIATVLAAYMGGLSLGAALAGKWLHHIRRPILVYGFLEGGIGLAALAVPWAIEASTSLSVRLFGQSDGPPSAEGLSLALFYAACSFLILMLPTALMGATLPLLSRHAVQTDAQLGRRIGALYATNTFGAILGTLVAGFHLLPTIGLFRTILVGVAVNFGVFLIAAWLARGQARLAPRERASEHRRAWIRSDWILPLSLLSGVTSFGYEVLWTRLFSQILGGSVYAFSTMLASFLAGITLGSAIAARIATDRRRALIGFAAAQLTIALSTLLAFSLADSLPGWVLGWTGGGGTIRLFDISLCGALLLPSTLAIGATFPLAVRITARGEDDAGPASARVYAWNTIGAIGGAIGAGFWLIPTLGFARSVGALAILNLLLAITSGLLLRPALRLVPGVAAVCAIGVLLWPPSPPWTLLRFAPLSRTVLQGQLEFSQVGRSANVLLLHVDGRWFVSSNGLPESGILEADSSSGDLTNRWLGALPSMARPQTRSMLVVGFGGGQVVADVPRSVERIDVVELEPAIVAANRAISDRRFLDPLADPRIRIAINDARGALVLTDKRYDAIVSQPSHPWTAGASHLYTREFFDSALAHLTPEGVFVQWIGLNFVDADLVRVLVATMRDVFPHVRVYRPPPWGALLFVGSSAPLPVEATVMEAIRASPSSFRRMGIQTPADVAIALVLDESASAAFAGDAPVSTDDVNILQMRSPRIIGSSLGPAGADVLLAPYDPIGALDLDPLYLVDRMASRRRLRARWEALRQAPRSESERTMMKAQMEHRNGRFKASRERLARLWQEGERDPRLQALLVVSARRAIEAGDEQALAQLGGFQDGILAVAEGWSIQNDSALRALEPRLAAVVASDLLYPNAIRLRARWRIEAGDPDLSAVAFDLLGGIVAGTDGTTSDFILRARAAKILGDIPTTLQSLEHAISRLSLSVRPEADTHELRTLLAGLQSSADHRKRIAGLQRRIDSRATRRR